MACEKLMIAVDGGGTKTEAVLFTQSGKILKRLLAGGMNPNTAGLSESVAVIRALVDDLTEGEAMPEGIFIGCAGCATGNNASEICASLKALFPACRIECVSDIITAAKSITDDTCVCCIAGTGSTVAVIEGKRLRLFSGTGALLGDTGSGFSIGKAALCHAIHIRDFDLPADSLTLAVEKQLNGRARDSIAEIYKKGVPFIAGLAKTVFNEYTKSPTAQKIIEENASFIATLISAILEKYPKIKRAAFTGSLMQSEIYKNEITKKLDAECIFSSAPQLAGAAVLCLEMCGHQGSALRDTFIKSYYEFLGSESNA